MRLVCLAHALVRARESELGGHEKWIDGECARERRDGAIVLLQLRRHESDEVGGVRVGRLERGGFLEGGERLLRVARAFQEQTEVVPGAHVLRVGSSSRRSAAVSRGRSAAG